MPEVRDALPGMRREYAGRSFVVEDLADGWLAQFERWLAEAVEARLPEPNAVVLATADASGRPGARTVLLKAADERGFALFTNLTSRKGRELAANPRAALCFSWVALGRQVVVDGAVEPVADEEADAYFASRPRGAQEGAWASPQSEVIAGREVLDRRRAEAEARFAGGDVARPPHWGGLRIVPEQVEFWQGRDDRLHDRLRFRHDGDRWVVERLAP